MKTIRATDANRLFSSVLKQVSKGEEFTVVSRGNPVAVISPARTSNGPRKSTKTMLLKRLGKQKPTGVRSWTRDELYERK